MMKDSTLEPWRIEVRPATWMLFGKPDLENDAGGKTAPANLPRLTFGKFSGRALVGSNKIHRSRWTPPPRV